jgi:hypothetical protein
VPLLPSATMDTSAIDTFQAGSGPPINHVSAWTFCGEWCVVLPLCWKAWHKVAVSSAKSLTTVAHHHHRVHRLRHISRLGRRAAGSSILKPIGVCTVIAASLGGAYTTSHPWQGSTIKAHEKLAANPAPQHPPGLAFTVAPAMPMETPFVLGADPIDDLQVHAFADFVGLSPIPGVSEIPAELPEDSLVGIMETADPIVAVPEPDSLTVLGTVLILFALAVQICRSQQWSPFARTARRHSVLLRSPPSGPGARVSAPSRYRQRRRAEVLRSPAPPSSN